MEVIVNTKKQILKSFLGWLPLAIFSVIFYGLIFVGLIMWGLTSFIGLDQELARKIGFPVGAGLLVVSIYLYLNWLTNSLSSYKLAVQENKILIRGIAGWSKLEKEVPLSKIQKINIGTNTNSLEKLSSGHGAISDQVASRLIFFLRMRKLLNWILRQKPLTTNRYTIF